MIKGSARALDPQTPAPLFDFHRGLHGWDKLAVMSLCLGYKVDVITILEITVRLQRPNYRACPRPHLFLSLSGMFWRPLLSPHTPPPLSLCLSLRLPCSGGARFILLWYHAHWSQTNHSHFPGSFPGSDEGLSLILSRDRRKKCTEVCLHFFFFTLCIWPSFSASLWSIKHVPIINHLFHCLFFKGGLFLHLWNSTSGSCTSFRCF